MAGGATITAGGGTARKMTFTQGIAVMAKPGQKVQTFAHHRDKRE
jgi:hypothetical protein